MYYLLTNEIDNLQQFHDSPPTHIAVEYLDNIQQLIAFKTQMRNTKLLYVIDLNEINRRLVTVKELVKTLTNNGFDGCIFEHMNESDSGYVKSFVKTLSQLPQPYNFKWEIYFDMTNGVLLQRDIDEINTNPDSQGLSIMYVFYLCDIHVFEKYMSNDKMIIKDVFEDKERVQNMCAFEGLRGIWNVTSQNYKWFFEQNSHQLDYTINHIEYPTCQILKEMNLLNDIVNMYIGNASDGDGDGQELSKTTPNQLPQIVTLNLDIDFI